MNISLPLLPRDVLLLVFVHCTDYTCNLVCYISVLFTVHLKIEEIGRMLRTGDLGVPANPSDRYVYLLIGTFVLVMCSISCVHTNTNTHTLYMYTHSLTHTHSHTHRSPSPEPIYSHDGKRLNTREVRVRKKLEDERHELVQQAINLNPEYRAPTDYK